MDNNSLLPNNSHKYRDIQKQKEEIKKIERVTHGEVKFKKKSSVRQFFDQFIQEDGEKIKSYVLGEVLIPSIKNAISDVVTNTINILFYGDAGRSKRNVADRVSYRSYYDSSTRRESRTPMTYNGYSYDDIILSTRGEAEDVLSRMDELIDSYGLVRVADLYDLVGITGSFTDNKYGWTNIRNAEIMRVRDGYMIKMPRAVPID